MSLRHLTDIGSLHDDVFIDVLRRSLAIREMMDRGTWPAPALHGRLAANLFYETSTRTLMSFEIAAKRLGALTATLPVSASSVQKGETLEDTVLTLAAQGADYLVLRATEPGTVARAIEAIENDDFPTSVLNAGEGALGHPSQGLLDASTVLMATGRRPEQGLRGITLAIIGDIRHSRVAASAIEAFSRLGADIRLGGPAELLPDDIPWGVSLMGDTVEDAIEGADIVMTLRLQLERMRRTLELSIDSYHAGFGLTLARLKRAKPAALIMHPGPMNRGVEIAASLADHPERSLIRSQVRQGVALRMALLEAIERGKDR